VVTSLKVTHCPAHTDDGPDIAAIGFTVIVLVAVQLPIAYVMVVVPPVRPDKMPVVEPIVPTARLLLVHTPPLVEFVRVIVVSAHITDGPDIVEGVGLTVTVIVAEHEPSV